MFFASDSPENDIPMEITTAEPQVSEVVYDCVICGQSGPSSEDRPTGLVVLLQASSGKIKVIFQWIILEPKCIQLVNKYLY